MLAQQGAQHGWGRLWRRSKKACAMSKDLTLRGDPRLPAVLTRQEVKSILAVVDHSDWLMVVLLYGAGLRLMECLQLRVQRY